MTMGLRGAAGFFLLFALAFTSCSQEKPAKPFVDHPQLIAGVKLVDVTFHSAALDRDMQYRAMLPAQIIAGQKLPVIYLLHGNDGGFRDWSNYSDVAKYAEQGLILIMPEGNSSYYMNSFDHPQDP